MSELYFTPGVLGDADMLDDARERSEYFACEATARGYPVYIDERCVRATLPPMADSAGEARSLARVALESWGLENLEETTALLVTELVSNGVRHAKTALTIVVSFDGSCLRVAVSDESQRLPTVAENGEVKRGWGLRLIELLASEWGTQVDSAGKTVWFELAVEDPSSARLRS